MFYYLLIHIVKCAVLHAVASKKLTCSIVSWAVKETWNSLLEGKSQTKI